MTLQKTVAAILKREVTVQEAKDFAEKQYGVLCSYLRAKQEDVRFPNGFEDWYETHHVIVALVSGVVDDITFDENFNNTIAKRFKEQGTGGMYELAREWTDEFENKYKGIVWGEELEYFDTIYDFFSGKK